jgi:hypothetical protein
MLLIEIQFEHVIILLTSRNLTPTGNHNNEEFQCKNFNFIRSGLDPDPNPSF